MSNLQLLLATALETKWALPLKTLQSIVSVIERDATGIDALSFHLQKREAYVGDLGERIEGARYTTIQGNTGIITISGPIVPRAGMMQGASTPELASYERLSSEFMMLEKNPQVKNILLVLDTPGGAVSGVTEFSQMIRNSTKNTQGFIIGMAASAGYWIGSSVKTLYSSRVGEAGSIGVVAVIQDRREADAKSGVKTLEIVSSVSPNKRLDPFTKEGKDSIQGIIDSLGDIFVSTVAENRNVSSDVVTSKFGAGGMLVAADALEVGMIDGITTLREIIQQNNDPASQFTSISMSEGIMATAPGATHSPDKVMSAEEFRQHNPSAYADILSLGANSERDRIAGIESITHIDAADLVLAGKKDPKATRESVALAFATRISDPAFKSAAATAKESQAPAEATMAAEAARKLGADASSVPAGATQTTPSETKAAAQNSLLAAMVEGMNAR